MRTPDPVQPVAALSAGHPSRGISPTGDDWDRHWADMHAAAEKNPAQLFRRQILIDLLRQRRQAAGVPLRLLDIGCGTGDFAVTYRDSFPDGEYLGLDVSAVGIEVCRAKVPGFRFQRQDLVHPGPVEPADRGWATAAVCSEVLEHLDDPVGFLKNALPYLAPGAALLITVPGGPISAFDRHIGHRQHFTNQQLARLIEQAGFQPLQIWGSGFPFYNLYRLTVILRGRKLVSDVSQSTQSIPLAARAVMSIFGILFRFNRRYSQAGWQRVALCQAPGTAPPRTHSSR